jgi:plastocyanin
MDHAAWKWIPTSASALLFLLSTSIVPAVEPGVDIAVPRVPISLADNATFRFIPANIVVEQGDYVRWTWNSGSHTTTSGVPCTTDLLWNSNISTTTRTFTRQFTEAPGLRKYFCSPHCGAGMTGQVTVTSPIDLTVTLVAGSSQLGWSGGGGLYRVYRADLPSFSSSTVLTAAGGTSLTMFSDAGAGPAAGSAWFYLVMNQF